MQEYHLIEPVYNQESHILILGSFPSVKSREANFYYYHPQNRFWKILEHLYCQPHLETINEKKEFLLNNKIALWDVIASCDIIGSSDSSIKNVLVNDLEKIINESKIEYIYTNGNLANKLYHQYFAHKISIPVIKLPSSSPANASYSLEKLISCWKVINSGNNNDEVIKMNEGQKRFYDYILKRVISGKEEHAKMLLNESFKKQEAKTFNQEYLQYFMKE